MVSRAREVSRESAATRSVTARRGLLTPFRAWRELRRLLRESQDALERSMRTSSSGSLVHLEALEYLGEHGAPVPQSQLQDALGLSQSSTSRLVSRLEANGYLRRSSSTSDARASLLVLTAAGVETTNYDLQRFAPMIRNELRTLTEALMPATAPGAESLLVPRREAADGSHLMKFGESVFSLTQSSASTMEAMSIRESLEQLMLTEAAQHWNPSDMAACRKILATMRASLHDAESFFRADWSLHRQLVSIGRNRLLQQIYGGLLSVVENNLEDVVPTSGLESYLDERLDVHTELVEAVASGNDDLIRNAVQRHAFTTRPHS